MDNVWLDRLQKLMAKAEDAATTVEERNSIVEKMTFLMAKHGIEAAMLNAVSDTPEEVTQLRCIIQPPYINPKLSLLFAISHTFGTQAILVEKPGSKRPDVKTVMQLFGYPSDLEKVMMLNGSLNIQMVSSLVGAQSSRPSGIHLKTFNSSFVVGYVDIVSFRIKRAYANAKRTVAENTTGTGMELVLRTREVAIQDAYRSVHPHTTRVNTSSRVNSVSAFAAGQSAGRNANIGQTGLSGGRHAIGG